jgi:hypothetical protein
MVVSCGHGWLVRDIGVIIINEELPKMAYDNVNNYSHTPYHGGGIEFFYRSALEFFALS